MTEFDVIVVGAGIAGASVAAMLAESYRVVVLEREEFPGYHSTGRSAALFSTSYGNAAVRALSRASRSFLFDPPPGFSPTPLIGPRGSLYIATQAQAGSLARFAATTDIAGSVTHCDGDAARRLVPILGTDVVAAVLEPDSVDVDVHALHYGFIRMLRQRGAALVPNAELTSLRRTAEGWEAIAGEQLYRAPIVVNAAGAWADRIAALAGVRGVGLQPCRRTAVLIRPPSDVDVAAWPMVIDIDECFYIKPDAGMLLISPADETPSEPVDAQPEELDIAIALHRVEAATSLRIQRIDRSWAGLRSFTADRTPAVGFAPDAHGFFWLAGQGGYGIQTAPALARLSAALIRDGAAPPDIGAMLSLADLSPARFGGDA